MDYYGNDIEHIGSIKSFSECVSACITTFQCVAVRFNPSGCYLKDGIGGGSHHDTGMAGRKCELVTECADLGLFSFYDETL